MSIYTTRLTVGGRNKFIGKVAQRLALALFVMSTAMIAGASELSDANARYQAERAVCQSGQSNQDRATCLKEAGAALHEAKMGRLYAQMLADRPEPGPRMRDQVAADGSPS